MKKLFLATLLVLFCSTLFAQNKVTGRVTSSEDGNPIPFASVVVKGTMNGVATDDNGVYTITGITPDQDYKLVVFQVNPKDLEIVGDVICTPVHTLPIEMTDLSFTFQTQGDVMTITPSDPDCLYYWDYDSSERIYDDYNGPGGFFYHLLDMFDEYGFMDEVYSKGPEQYDFGKDNLRVGKEYIIVAAACDDGEKTSKLQVLSFIYVRGKIEIKAND